ncbi:energy-coupling factor transporter ATPase [Sporolactobacillus spathodeae]|uniref:Energy-coupling factor transporter ATP-binding protein EcfA2 n=1 Tax=Sporolactobacillus spathodeae TaxID=1465502 RepID=A0ABS2QBR4_9BACL|nr:energy-coupling factor transport system ATP-binding protein [Sporolactobacillus spathodeae]
MDITVNHVTHTYQPGTPFMRMALNDVSVAFPSGSFTSIIGHTGSGKSTLAQHLNGLLLPSTGSITAGDLTLEGGSKRKKKKINFKALREKVGYVFQYPEHQLFEETLLKDVAFGPINFGVPQDEAGRRAKACLELVHIPSAFWERSPFDLSGGQMRRVAIAGVLAVQPEVIILDEPTAGLDPRGRKEIMDLFDQLHRQQKRTIIMVTHNMSDAALYSDQVVVMNHGSLIMAGSPAEVFSRDEALQRIGLESPETMQFIRRLAEKIGTPQPTLSAFTMEDTADAVLKLLKGDAAHV